MALNKFHVKKLCDILFLCLIIDLGLSAKNGLRVITDCICPEQNITYECSAVGGSFTVWNGSIMEPPGCEIELSHTQFMNNTAHLSCNDGAIAGRGIEISNNCYTSMLTVLVNPNLNGTDLTCSVDYVTNVTVIGTMTVIITRAPFPPPSNIQLIDAKATELVFNWSPPPETCPSLIYFIDTENCGTCQNNVANGITNTTCSNFNLSIVCTLKVYSVICGNLMSVMPSNVVTVNLTVPKIVSEIEIVPYYSDSDSRLLRLMTQFLPVDRHVLSNNSEIDGSATSYTITYFNSKSGSSCGTATILSSFCNKICSHMFEISSSSCPPASDISVKVSATSVLGEGPVKVSSISGNGTNNFVDVKFTSSTRSITCTFLNQTQPTQKECTAVIMYGADCDQLLDIYSNTDLARDSVSTPPIETMDDTAEYCFSVTASSTSTTVNKTVVIEGTLNIIGVCDGRLSIAVSIVATVAVVFIICTIVLIILLLLLLCKKYRYAFNKSNKNE